MPVCSCVVLLLSQDKLSVQVRALARAGDPGECGGPPSLGVGFQHQLHLGCANLHPQCTARLSWPGPQTAALGKGVTQSPTPTPHPNENESKAQTVIHWLQKPIIPPRYWAKKCLSGRLWLLTNKIKQILPMDFICHLMQPNDFQLKPYSCLYWLINSTSIFHTIKPEHELVTLTKMH